MDLPEAEQRQALARQLAAGIEKLGLTVGGREQELLLDYLEQLLKWNQAYNLSGIRDAERMLVLHLLDSLSILPFIDAQVILDVGTGAGLPGIPLAICCPEKTFYLLDSNGKKTRFMFQTVTRLELDNVIVVQSRAESYHCPQVPDIIVSRAFSSLRLFCERTRHLLGDQSKLLAMKGQYPQAELDELPPGYKPGKVHVLSLPGEAGERHLLEIIRDQG